MLHDCSFVISANFGHEIASPNVRLVGGGISFVSGDGNLRLIQQRKKFLFFPAGNINMMIVAHDNITTLAFNIF
jgi:hypothetical protein